MNENTTEKWVVAWRIIVDQLWQILLYVLIALAIYRKDYDEGTFWLAFLILRKLSKDEQP